MTDTALAALYERRVRDWARRARDDLRLADADVSVTRTSPICGSRLTLDLRCESGRIVALGHRARACTLGMAATAIVVAGAIGETLADVLTVGEALAQLLDGAEVGFPERWRELEIFAAARAFPMRRGSILLPFDALAEASSRLTP